MAKGMCIIIWALGPMVTEALKIAGRLAAEEGLSVGVVNARFIKPLDAALLADVWRRHREVFTLEENTIVGGFGAGVLEWAAERDEQHPQHVTCVGIPDAFQEHDTRAELLAGMGLDAASLADRVATRLAEVRGDDAGSGSARAGSAS